MPLHPWEWLGKPWSRMHADYAGPFQGKMFLVLLWTATRNGLTYMLQVQLPQLSLLTNFKKPSCLWPPGNDCFQYWDLFEQPGISNLCEAKQNSTCKNHSLSPLIKWPCQMVCTKCERWFKENYLRIC